LECDTANESSRHTATLHQV